MNKLPSNAFHEIISNLFLGNQLSTDYAMQIGIDFIISIGSRSKAGGIENLHIGLVDDKTIDIQNELNQVIPLIHELLSSGKRVLIHCKAGMNRSPSFVLAYLCKYHSKSIEEGMQFILTKRRICKFSMKDQVQVWLNESSS